MKTRLIDNYKKQGGSWISGVKGLPDFWPSAFWLVLCTASIQVLSLALPLTLMQVYDRIIPYNAAGTLLWLVLGCGVAFILESALRFIRSWISGWTAARFDHFLSQSAFEHLLRSQLSAYENEEPGIYLDRLGSIGTLRNFYSGQIFQVMLDLPFASLFLYAIWFLAGELVWFPIGVILAFLFLAGILKIGYELNRRQQLNIDDRRFNFLFELLGGVHLVKSLTLEEQMLRRYERLQATAVEINHKVSIWSILPTNVGSFFSHISLFGVIGLGASSVIQGQLTIGGLTACAMLAGRALQPVQSAAGFWLRLSEAKLARQQVRQLANLPLESEPGALPFPRNIEGYIEFEQVSHRLKEELPDFVTDLSVQIHPREMVVISGENTNHTTALLALIQGLVRPYQGNLLIDDYDLTEWDRSDLNGLIEYVPQSGVLFSGTLLDNLTLFDQNRQATAIEAATLLGLDELVASLPRGYETEVKGQANNVLPSGLIQRISMARALVTRPRILLLDRTVEAMDQDSSQIVLEVLRRLKGHSTIVLVSNSPALVNLADRVFDLKDNQLVEQEKFDFSFN